jgi:hypothetical protein
LVPIQNPVLHGMQSPFGTYTQPLGVQLSLVQSFPSLHCTLLVQRDEGSLLGARGTLPVTVASESATQTPAIATTRTAAKISEAVARLFITHSRAN